MAAPPSPDAAYRAHLRTLGIADQAQRISGLVREHKAQSPESPSVASQAVANEEQPPGPPADPIAEAVGNLVKHGMKMLALDFDQTFVDCHTGGNYSRGPGTLSERVRDFMPALVCEAARRGIHVAICTFSPQTRLIAEVLSIVLPEDLAESIVVRGNDNSWEIPRGCEGKQAHLESAGRAFGEPIVLEEMCLVDDDNRNIMFARCSGVMSVFCPPHDSPRATKDAVLRGLSGSPAAARTPKHTPLDINTSTYSPGPAHRHINTRDPFSQFSQSPPPSPHSPYSPYPSHLLSPGDRLSGFGSPHSPYGSPRSPMRSPMGGGMGSSPRRFF